MLCFLPLAIDRRLHNKWRFGSVWCGLDNSVKLVNMFVSGKFDSLTGEINFNLVYLLTMLSIDRYITIVRQNTMMRENITKRKRILTYGVIVFIWFLAIVATKPYYNSTVYRSYNDNEGQCGQLLEFPDEDDLFDRDVPDMCQKSQIVSFIDKELKFHAENKTLQVIDEELSNLESFVKGETVNEIHNSISFLSRVFEEESNPKNDRQIEQNGWTLELCEERERQNISPTLL